MSIVIEIWKEQPGKFFCISTKSAAGKWKDHFFSPDEFGDIKHFLKDYDDHDIYFCPHGFNRRSRQKQEAVLPNLLWADLDFSDPRAKIFKGIKPTIAIESSPGRFVGLWKLKNVMTESLNRRLTYHVEADHGGWDLTQVLRFPGTKNYKYKSQPRVRMLWDDGPEYTRKAIEKHLPTEEEGNTGEMLSAADVFEEYEGKLPRWVRRELVAKKITGRADRSEMLWKLENACLEAGMSIDESYAVIRHSAWNKFKGRRNEEDQLRRELQKVVEHQFSEPPKGKDKRHTKSDREISEEDKDPVQSRFIFKPISEIEEEAIEWLWYPYLAKKEVTILEGDPGLGKSYMAMMVAGAIAANEKLPSTKKGMKRGHGAVVYFDIENNAGSVTKVRLRYNGFDKLNNYYPVEQAFSIDDEDAIEEIYEHLDPIEPVLIVFDTLNTYIGRADTHKASESTQAMNLFKELARDFNCAVLVLRHLTKGAGPAMYRGQGSIAFSGSVRMVMQVGVHPDDSEVRVMAQIKNNIAPKAPGLCFEIIPREKGASEFKWGDYTDLTAEQVMDASHKARTEGNKGTHVQDAMEFLEKHIKNAWCETSKLLRMGEKRGITAKVLERAAHQMNVQIKTKKGVTSWFLDADDREDDDED